MADVFITGVFVEADAVEWTTLRRRKGQIEVAEHRRLALPTDNDAARQSALGAAIRGMKGPIAVALPTEKALLRAIRLPTIDLAEIRDMAALQVDKFSPFPAEHMAIGQEVVAQDQTSSLVVVAAALNEHVEACAETFRRAARLPRDLDISVFGWWRLLRQEGHLPEDGWALILLAEGPRTELLAIQRGAPIIIRSLGPISAADPASSALEFAEEIAYTVTLLESEWGLPAPERLELWRKTSVPASFVDTLSGALPFRVEPRILDTLPPLSEGIARRALERGPHVLDLAPSAWKAAIASKRLRRNLAVAACVMIAIWLGAVGSVAAALKIRQGRLAAAQAELAEMRAPARAVEQLKEQVRSLERYMDPRYSPLECLREISERLPAGVDLTAFTYKKFGQISLRGEADQSDPIYEFFSQLEKSTLFPSVKPEGITQQQRGGKNRSQFKVTIELPPEAK
ncbi:MAG: PilN domain-containing protein [Kiritimatiellae bacterium]|nr:PilN domain-containing protein [Kiritimatiellia bacterium]MDW8458818.1 PilN domain-containing protein [Verrucomicrobiota bacterium]